MERFFDRMGKLGFGLIGSGLFLTNFIFVVEPGYRAIIQNNLRGLQPRVYGEGMHFRLPIRDQVKSFEVRTQPKVLPCETNTKDMQACTIVVRVLFRPVEEELATILLDLGQDYELRLLPQISQEVLKTTAAQYTAEQLISLREKVSKEVKEILQKRALENNIIIDDVSLTDLQFTREFMAAIEMKQVAQQKAEMEKFNVQRKQEEVKADILRAEGEAEAAQLLSNAINEYGPGIVTIRKIEAATHIATELHRSPNVTFISGSNTMNMLKI